MFRVSLIISVSLMCCIAAKPWNKHPDEAIQETVRAIGEKEELSLKVEVEPPEDMGGIYYNIDPRMRIWKSMTGTGQDRQPLKVEEDLDELYHPSVPELLQVQNQNLGPADDIQLLQEVAKIQYRQEAEEDRDDIYHPVFEKVAAEIPDEAREVLAQYLFPLVAKNKVHLQPEEDMDSIYHKDSLMPVVNQDNTEAAASLDLFQGKYSVPEEDMDDLYHQ